MGRYLIDFPDELHKKSKILAIQKGITLKELILESVRDYLKKKQARE